jgi:hypothetical protein
MDPNLEKLISLHDLDIMIEDLSRNDIRKEEEKLGLSADEAQKELRKLRKELRSKIDKRLLARYDRLASHYGNAVVPAIQSRCSGCLTRLPTAMCSDPNRNERIRSCPTCGRIIYWAD